MTGYSDPIHHALTFAAKHLSDEPSGGAELPWRARPAGIAILLARGDADETTLIAGILHALFEAAPDSGNELRHKVGSKFGSAVLAVALDAAIPHHDAGGALLDWRSRRREMLSRITLMEPRALDIRCAAEVHDCGAALANARRLGPEYLEAVGYTSCRDGIPWHADLKLALASRRDWTSPVLRRDLDDVTDAFSQLGGS